MLSVCYNMFKQCKNKCEPAPFYSLHPIGQGVYEWALIPWPLPRLNENTLHLLGNNSPWMLRCPQRYNNQACIRPQRRGLLVTPQNIDFFFFFFLLKACSLLRCCICPSVSPRGRQPHNTSQIWPRRCYELLNTPISGTHILLPLCVLTLCVCAHTCAQTLAHVSSLYWMRSFVNSAFSLHFTRLASLIYKRCPFFKKAGKKKNVNRN